MVRIIAAAALAALLGAAPVSAQSEAADGRGTTATLPDYTHGAKAFPDIFSPYRPDPIQPLPLENSPRLRDLIHGRTLQLSLSDALALAIENNLDIAVQRYVHPIAEADILRTSSGQAARGVPGALLPSGLSAGALGVGVNQSNGPGGVGNAGGISGGGGAVQVGQAGTFDPALTFNASYDSTTSPLNSLVVAGVPKVTTASSASSLSYTQLFPEGSSVTWTVSGIAQNSTQRSLLFNPAVVSRMALGFNQPLLNGFGFLPNKRFVLVAANDLRTSDELFRQQVTATIVQVEDAYWDLSASREAIAAAERAVQAARELVNDTKARVEIGTAAGVDVVSAQAAAASAERDLIVARTNYELQQAQLKNLISRQNDPDLDATEIEPVDALPDPDRQPPPDLQAALATALQQRPDLAATSDDLQSQDVTARFTRNGLLPSVSVFGLYAGAGLTGDSPTVSAGLGASLREDFNAAYPEYAAGLSATIPIRNRSAQADNLRARLEEQQLEVRLQRARQQVGLEVRQAVINLTQGRAQAQAAREALRLAERTVEAEQAKLQAGVSTAYDVILRERDLLAARQSEVAAKAACAKALVDFDRATGTTLQQNGIELSDALVGSTRRAPAPAMVRPSGTDRER